MYYGNVYVMTAASPALALAAGSALAVDQNAPAGNTGRKPAVIVAVDVFKPQGKL